MGRNTVPTIVITIVTLVIFSTSVYGFVIASNLKTPVEDIPEVKSIGDVNTDISPTPNLENEIGQEVSVPLSDTSALPTISVPPLIVNNQGQQNNQTSVSLPIPTVNPNQQNNSSVQNNTPLQPSGNNQAIIGNEQIQVDNDVEDVNEDNDSDHDEEEDEEDEDGDDEQERESDEEDD